MIFDYLAYLTIWPNVSVQNLARKFLRILNVHEKPTIDVLRVFASFQKRTKEEYVAGRPEEILETFGSLGDSSYSVCSSRHVLLLTSCDNQKLRWEIQMIQG